MSFLDHLEELRVRLFKSFAAIAVGCVAGWFLVDRWHAVAFLKAPIAPYLPDGKLIVLSPTEPLMIAFKLAVILGCILASPVVLWQVWAFLSPALYAKERKVVVPVLIVGTILFLSGATLSFIFVVPQALRVLFSFQSDALATMITFEKYFDFITQLMLAMGISFELPLVMVILAAFGLVTPSMVSKFRRVAIIILLFAGAILSPGTDVLSMMMLSVPMILLYEVGYIGVIIAARAKARTVAGAGVVILLLGLGAGSLRAQVPGQPPLAGAPTRGMGPLGGQQVQDTTRGRRTAKLDSAAARRLGLPTAPSREFPATDSILDRLLDRPGYEATRFLADTATLFVPERRIDLQGRAMTSRNGSILEAQRIGYEESSCEMEARGDPKVFDRGTVMIGEGLRYNTCERRAVVSGALTNFQQGGVEWFMRGTLSQDSTASRIYASHSQITSCDLPVAHYHFSARESKWISKSVLVSRPAILYVRDVPTLWLPFIFQDGRPGRHSGILVPQFGINDIVRPSRSYSRQVTNIGYFWAPNPYFDASARLDWYSERQTRWGVGAEYRWLDRAMTGSLGYNRLSRAEGSSVTLLWNHHQSFSLTSTLDLQFDFVSNSAVQNTGAIDPRSNTQQISSMAKYDKRFAWGTFSVGGNRRQNLNDGSITQEFPALTFSPNPLDLPGHITWSPAATFRLDRSLNTPNPSGYPVFLPGGGVDTLGRTFDTRTTTFALETPFRIGGFTWRNSLAVTDLRSNLPKRDGDVKIPDLSTPDPTDSVTISHLALGDFSTGVDWNTGINLPILFRGSWKITPGVGITNVTGGPFLLRNRQTGGDFVAQTKRAQLTLTSNPTFFAFFPGFGPIARIRHSLLPTLSFSYSPEASIPEAYARALAAPGQTPVLTAHATQTASFGLTQTFEAKGRPAPGDTSANPNVRKYRLLSLNTSALSYDFEQAKLPHRTGWTTQTLSNTIQSDLIPGLNVSLTHDLWRGRVGTDSAVFKPYLTGVSASFGVNAGTFRGLGRLLGFGPDSAPRARQDEPPPPSYIADAPGRPRPGSFSSSDQVQRTGHTAFSSSFNFSLVRDRPDIGATNRQPDHVSLGFNTTFSPTAFWMMSWQSQYNFTEHRFESQVIRLERDLHEWRASFNFIRNPNGNVQFYFNISLMDLPAVKFDYNQTTLPR